MRRLQATPPLALEPHRLLCSLLPLACLAALRETADSNSRILAAAVAHCNLGLAYQALNRLQEAATNHQHALRYAIRMSSLAGESLACGHLGMIGATDAETSKACTERQLQLARTLQDHRAKEDAYLQLGGLAQASGSHDQAHDYFTAALEEADRQHDAETADLARCQLGLADGGHEFEAFLQAQQQM